MRKLRLLLTLVITFVAVPAALAGGWASVTVDEPPGEIRAGEPWIVGLTVWQHGVTPVHNLGEGMPVEPTFVATSKATGQRVEAIARPDKEIGRFTLEVTLPSEGEWEWVIYPAPLAGDETRRSLTVLPPLPAGGTGNLLDAALSGAPLLPVIGLTMLVLALGAVPWIVARRGPRTASERVRARE